MSRIPALAAAFAPHAELAGELLPHAFAAEDGSHDASHLIRVWKNALRIQAEEGGDIRQLAAAVLLHDCVSVEKNSPLRAEASRLAAEKASAVLGDLGWSPADISSVAHAILPTAFRPILHRRRSRPEFFRTRIASMPSAWSAPRVAST